jgi:hypothetical protein
MFENPWKLFFLRFSKSLRANSNFEFKIRPCIPSILSNLFPFFYSLQCKPTKGGKEICWDLSLDSQDLGETFSLSVFVWIEGGKGSPRQTLAANHLSLCSSNTAASIDPQSPIDVWWHPRMTPLGRDRPQPPHAALPSPCPPRPPQPILHATVHLLQCHLANEPASNRGTNSLKQDHPSMPVRAAPTTPTCASSGVQTAQSAPRRSRAPRPRLASLSTRPCMVSTCSCNTTLALHR